MRTWMLTLSAFSVLAYPSLGQAQQVLVAPVERQPLEVSISAEAGTLVPVNNVRDLGDASAAYGVGIGLSLTNWLGLEANYLEAPRGGGLLSSDVFWRGGDVNLKLMAARSVGRVGLVPYVSAGFGFYGFGNQPEIPEFLNDTLPQVPLGVGLAVDINEDVALGGEFVYHILLDNFGDAGLIPGPNVSDVWHATANLTFRL